MTKLERAKVRMADGCLDVIIALLQKTEITHAEILDAKDFAERGQAALDSMAKADVTK